MNQGRRWYAASGLFARWAVVSGVAWGLTWGLTACGGAGERTDGATVDAASVEVGMADDKPIDAGAQVVQRVGTRHRMLRLSANFVVDTADEQLALVDRARAKGANAVVFSDTKLVTHALGGDVGTRWPLEMRRFVDGVKQRGMRLVLDTISLGYCSTMLSPDRNLTTGYPIVDQPMRARAGKLEPVSTAAIANGGFEQASGDVATDWGFQDAPGQRTFVDTAVKRSGNASLRADARDGESSRIFTSFAVKPWHQYVLSFWVKTDRLSAGSILPIVLAGDDPQVALTSQRLSTPKADGSRAYFSVPDALTLDWTEMRLAFNSQGRTSVTLALAVYGGRSGSVWWDDVAVTDAPTLNWLERADLPRTAKLEDGTALALGRDVAEPVDPRLGQDGFPGRYATYQPAPQPDVLDTSKVGEGATVRLSGWHAMVTMGGQAACSWNHPRIHEQIRTVFQKAYAEYKPYGFLLDYDETRTGGYEPADVAYGSSGAAMAASIRKALESMVEVAPRAKRFFWSDMVDPNHNARAKYYQIPGTLAGSWEGLSAASVTVVTWWSGQDLVDKAPSSLAFFAGRGHEQVLGAYYDEDVITNHARWQAAAQGVQGVTGSMFCTWIDDYSRIEAFGSLWWGVP